MHAWFVKTTTWASKPPRQQAWPPEESLPRGKGLQRLKDDGQPFRRMSFRLRRLLSEETATLVENPHHRPAEKSKAPGANPPSGAPPDRHMVPVTCPEDLAGGESTRAHAHKG